MPLGSAPISLIDIDFTRANGTGSEGRILISPPRVRIGSTMLSRYAVPIVIKNGKGKIELAHIPLGWGTYHIREEIDGKAPYEFDFALPIGSPSVIEYETIAQVSAVPAVYTVVRTINGVAPNPTTGDIVVDAGGSDEHTHPISEIEGLAAALAGKAPSVHSHLTTQITNFQIEVEEIAQAVVDLATEQLALPNRILRVKDKSKEGVGNTYNLPDTGGNWVLFAGGPSEYVIEANVGDDINLDYDFQMDQHVTAVLDFAVVDASGFLVRYLGSGTSIPTYDGLPGVYPASERFQGLSGMTGLTVEADDIDGGYVHLQWAIKTSADNGKIYANNNSPLTMRIVNTRLSGL